MLTKIAPLLAAEFVDKIITGLDQLNGYCGSVTDTQEE